jgi:hypothetical protein
VFSPEVDDKGIDFVLRVDSDPPGYYDVQVKTVRSKNTPAPSRVSATLEIMVRSNPLASEPEAAVLSFWPVLLQRSSASSRATRRNPCGRK